MTRRGKLALAALGAALVVFAAMVSGLREIAEAGGFLPQSSPLRSPAAMDAFRDALGEAGLIDRYRGMLVLDHAFMLLVLLALGLGVGGLTGWGVGLLLVGVGGFENWLLLDFITGGPVPDPRVTGVKLALYAGAVLLGIRRMGRIGRESRR